jgi:hypothetical protein
MLIERIRAAVQAGSLLEPFDASMVRQACPGPLGRHYAPHTHRVFLSKHCVGNPGGYIEYFRRIGHGSYELVRPGT